MAVIAYYLRPINIFIIVGVAVWVYFATLIALRAFTKEDVDIINSILGRT
jgi:hypothetical protein